MTKIRMHDRGWQPDRFSVTCDGYVLSGHGRTKDEAILSFLASFEKTILELKKPRDDIYSENFEIVNFDFFGDPL